MPNRHELTGAQWAKVEGLLAGKASDPGRTAADSRLSVSAVVHVLETRTPWADLPARSGNHDAVRKRFDRRCARGAWARVAAAAGAPARDEVR
ncbi:MAG TPA: transposase, partial [Humisphaera sp.]